MDSNVIIDGRPYSVGSRGLALICKIIKLNSWLEKAPAWTIEFNGGAGDTFTTRKGDFERDNLTHK